MTAVCGHLPREGEAQRPELVSERLPNELRCPVGVGVAERAARGDLDREAYAEVGDQTSLPDAVTSRSEETAVEEHVVHDESHVSTEGQEQKETLGFAPDLAVLLCRRATPTDTEDPVRSFAALR